MGIRYAVTSTPALTLKESVDLVHALVASEASRVGVRVLFVKGPAARAQALRAPDGVSNDVDVWIEPGGVDALLAALEVDGWERTYDGPAVDAHSITLWNPRWACEVDAHHHFPGFFLEAGRLFEELWSGHEVIEIAHQPVTTPRADKHALVLALHALRATGRQPANAELERLTEACRKVLTAGMRDRMGRTAYELGAADTASQFIDLLGVTAVGRRTTSAADMAAWALITGEGDRTSVAWLTAVGSARPRELPGLVWHALWLTREEIAATQKGTVSDEFVREYRWKRLKRGVRALPRAVRTLRGDR